MYVAVVPEVTLDLYNKVQAGDHKGAKALHDRFCRFGAPSKGRFWPQFAAKSAGASAPALFAV